MSSHRLRRIGAIALISTGIVACHRNVATCARCHMTLQQGDVHETEITYADGSVDTFDSAVCAVAAWKHPSHSREPKSMMLHEYYSGAHVDSFVVTMVRGSDVAGPMGDDLIAVDPANAKKFMNDHGGKAAKLGGVEVDVLQEGP